MKRPAQGAPLWFVMVGAGAAATHLGVFTLLQHSRWAGPAWAAPWGSWPEVHNAMAFLVAFAVSFVGHRRLSFADSRLSVRQSLPRFAATALLGLAVNEVWFVVLHRALGWSPTVALITATVLVAGQTWVLGRLWAFRR